MKNDPKLIDTNVEEVYIACQDIVQNDLKPNFERSVNKAANCKQRPYTAKEFEHYFINNRRPSQRDVRFDESSISQSSSASGHSSRYRDQNRNRSSSKRSYSRRYRLLR